MMHIVNDRASTEIVTIHRSTRPGAKAGARTTPDGLPVHGFDPLLHDLATLTLNHMNLAPSPRQPHCNRRLSPCPISAPTKRSRHNANPGKLSGSEVGGVVKIWGATGGGLSCVKCFLRIRSWHGSPILRLPSRRARPRPERRRALALVVFAIWRPFRVMAGAWLSGGVTILQLQGQALGLAIPSELPSAPPYLATIAVLVIISRNRQILMLHFPASLARPFRPSG